MLELYKLNEITSEYLNNKHYDGSEKKFGITIDGKDYIMKFQKKNWNNVYSEYVASNIINILGGLAHTVYLGLFENQVVCLCEDFIKTGQTLRTYTDISSSSIDFDTTNLDYFYTDVETYIGKYDLMTKFNAMYVYDALLGNSDRHKGNWGLIKADNKYSFTPIFDNGASLFPRALNINITEDWVRERVFVFPNSKIMFNTKRERSSYFEVLSTHKQFDSIRESITDNLIERCFTFIECSPIPSELKSLYKTVLYYRYKCLIKLEEFNWRGVIW